MSKDTKLIETEDQRALKVIEALTMVYENTKMTKEDGAKVIGDIFTVCHGVGKHHSCYDVHDDWRKNTEKLYKEFKEIGYL